MNTTKKLIPVIAIIFLFSVILSIAARFHIVPKLTSILADHMISLCKHAPFRPSCYDSEIPKLMKYVPMEYVFAVTKQVQTKESTTYTYCHVLGHALGSREVKKNPSKWKDVIARCPTGMCANGCIHGAFQERFHRESMTPVELETVLKPELFSVCEPRGTWNPTRSEIAACYHAIGHLGVYVSKGNIARSLSLCEDVATKASGGSLARVCYDGVFMQIFQPLEPEDKAVAINITPTRETLGMFCKQFTSDQEGSCWNEGWPLFKSEIMTPTGLVTFCSHHIDESQKVRCLNDEFYLLVSMFRFDKGKIESFCSQMPQGLNRQCFANMASRMIEVDKGLVESALDICRFARIYTASDQCYEELSYRARISLHTDSSEYKKLCQGLIDPWKKQCEKSSL